MKSPNVPLSIRAIAVAYRFDLDMPIAEIATRLSQPVGTLKTLFRRIQHRAQSNMVLDLVRHLEDTPRTGRPSKIEPGSKESLQIRDRVRSLRYQDQTTAANTPLYTAKHGNILAELDANIPRLPAQQVHNIAQGKEHSKHDNIDSRPIKQKREIVKPAGYDPHKRLKYTKELQEMVDNKDIVVCCNKKKFGVGGTANKHVSMPQGEDSFGTRPAARFILKQWAAATAQDLSITRPHIIWTAKDKGLFNLQAKLNEANAARRRLINEKRYRGTHDTTSEEYLELQRLNQEVKEANGHRREQKIPGSQQKWTPQRLFPYEDLKSDSDKLEFTWYAFKVYQELLFPYIQQLRANNPGKRVTVIEDNSTIHHKARKLMAAEIERQSIHFANHPAFSPDLNPIETLHREETKPIKQYLASVTSAAEVVRQEAGLKLKEVWQSKSFDTAVTKYCSHTVLQTLKKKLEAANGHNNFSD